MNFRVRIVTGAAMAGGKKEAFCKGVANLALTPLIP